MESQSEDVILLGYESEGSMEYSAFIQGSRDDSFLGKGVQRREYIQVRSKEGPVVSFV